jgi:hypothetical protein
MSRTFLSALFSAVPLLALFATPAIGHAQSFSPVSGTATLTVTYKLVGAGDEIPKSKERHVRWSVDDSYEIKATMLATKPGGFGALHKADATEQAREQKRTQAAQTAQADMSGMMAQAQAIMDKCGDNETCIQRETMKMSQGIDMNSKQMKSAKENIAVATAMPGDRYQLFQADKQTGTFRIDEKAQEAYFDAACSLKNEETCTQRSTVKGSGAQDDGKGNTSFSTGAMAEYDAAKGTLVILFPGLGVSRAERVVDSKGNSTKNGKSTVMRSVKSDALGKQVQVSCGQCKTASGRVNATVKDELLGRDATLTVDWKFSRP